MRQFSSQSAMEFMLTYGYVFLIIAIAVSVLVLFLGVPRTTIPFQCNFYSGFSCTDVVLIPSNAGASLIIAAIDNQPGVVNASVFNGMINYHSSTNGFCLPSRILDGQYVYCVANFTFTPVFSNVYYGTFNLTANYCTGMAQNLSTLTCPASNVVVYGGSARVEPSQNSVLTNTLNSLITNSPITFYYAPVTITNNQPVASAAPFQLLINFPDGGTYAPYLKLAPDGAWSTPNNIEFSTLPADRGTILEAWIESVQSSPATTNDWIWVNLPLGIPANTTETIYVNFMPFNTVSSYGPLGLGPGVFGGAGFSGSYTTPFDDGAEVFDFYDNFVGTTLNLNNWKTFGSGITVNNGLTISAGSTSSGVESIAQWSPIGHALDVNIVPFTASVTNSFEIGFNAFNTPTRNALYYLQGYSVPNWGLLSANATGTHASCQGSGGLGEPDSAVSLGGFANVIGAYENYGGGDNSCYGYPAGFQCYISPACGPWSYNALTQTVPIYIQNNVGGVSSGSSVTMHWVRIRGTPPDAIMPSVSLGQVVTLTT